MYPGPSEQGARVRVLGIGPRLDLGDMYLSLLREGHDVRVHAANPSYAGCFEGLLDPVIERGLRAPGT